jgi:RNA-directed DNA polymerase
MSGDLLSQVLARENLQRAWKRVKGNKGSPGIDGMTIEETPDYLQENWARIREELVSGSYRPNPVLRREIPKPGGGKRELGIPTVVDRLIQQAILQVLQPLIDPSFSPHSHGFRPGRGAQGAVREAQSIVQSGRRVVVDVDLEKFFDRVNHDILMGRLAKRIGDKPLLGLIRRYLEAGVMFQGTMMERVEGTPQGGPLSPLLANVLLDEVDRKLEERGHRFVRYADDLKVYVYSKRAGERVMHFLRRTFTELHLKVNERKSKVRSAFRDNFLGFGFWVAPGKQVKLRVSAKAVKRLKQNVRWKTRRTKGRKFADIVEGLRSYLLGWRGYFRLAETRKIFSGLDEWIRHRLRSFILRQWKRGTTAFKRLRSLGASEEVAAMIAGNLRSWWRNSAKLVNSVFPNAYFDEVGIPRLVAALN